METTFHTVDLSMLRVGATLSAPIFSQSEKVKLLSENIPITADLVELLKNRGMTSVIISKTDLSRLQAFRPQGAAKNAAEPHSYVPTEWNTAATRQLQGLLENPATLTASDTSESPLDLIPHQTGPYNPDLMAVCVDKHEESVTCLAELFEQFNQSLSPELGSLEEVCHDSLSQMQEDVDLFVCLSVNPFLAEYPFRHSLHTAKTAVVIGLMMGLGTPALHDLALGCLIHDLGMLKLGSKVFALDRRLVPSELRQLADHPIHSLELLESRLDSLSTASQCVAFQLHERCNGRGYPRGVPAEGIHLLAKIAGVADTFVALVSDRSYRRGLQPYYAMETLLKKVRDRFFDVDVVRALLNAVSLFPIGSNVKLSDGRVGRVIRSNHDHYDRPVIEAWDQDRPYISPVSVNLIHEPDLTVIRPLPQLKSA